MKYLAVNLATRGRPELAYRTAVKTMENISLPDTRFMISLDDDDEASLKFFDRSSLPLYRCDLVGVKTREDSTGEKFNRVLSSFPDADLYVPMVDYVAQITPGWDAKFLEAVELFPDGIGVVCNHLANASFPFTMGATRKLVEKTGFLFPPYFPYWFVDHWLDSIARLLNRYSFADTHVEIYRRPVEPGAHPTMEYREIEFWSAFFDTGYYARRQCALNIIDSPDFTEPEWRKNQLRRNFPLIETRDFWINKTLRDATPPTVSPGLGDDRYWRLRDRAVALSKIWLGEIRAAGVDKAGVLSYGL